MLESIKNIFEEWMKKKLHFHTKKGRSPKYFHEREVWWASLGKNIEYEIDGKNDLFERPILILKRYSEGMVFILPISTQIKEPKPGYHEHIRINGKLRLVNLTQGRVISTKRLLRRQGKLDSKNFQKVKNAFIKQFL